MVQGDSHGSCNNASTRTAGAMPAGLAHDEPAFWLSRSSPPVNYVDTLEEATSLLYHVWPGKPAIHLPSPSSDGKDTHFVEGQSLYP